MQILKIQNFHNETHPNEYLKPLQNKKDQNNLGYPRKKQSFYKEKDWFFLGYPKFFWPFLFWSGFIKKMSTKIHRKCPWQFTKKCPPKFTQKEDFSCPQEFTKSVHENSLQCKWRVHKGKLWKNKNSQET